MVPARTWGVRAVVMAPTERFKLRRQMAAAAGKKEYALVVPFHGYPDLGSMSLDWRVVHRTSRSLVESGSSSPDVETSERACRSGDVRDP